MKKLLLSLLLIVTITLLTTSTFAQNVTVNPGAGSYATLKDAFDAINAGTHIGAITVTIVGNTTETATAVLNASGSGSASYTNITISPSGGSARTISGAIAAGSPLLDLNGADNVTIDGLNSGGNSLTIENSTVSTTSGTSTIRFQTDATNNLITKCTILGASTMPTTTNGGTIWFAAGAITTGNDNNTISFCDIGPSGSNLPTKAIYGNGTTTSTATYNSGIVIDQCNIYDFFNAAAQSNGIYVAGGNTDWTISNNKFYQTASRTQTTGAIHSPIQLASTNINNCIITGNTVGYASSSGTGTYNFVGVSSSSRFYPIYLSSHGTTTATSIQGNTITAISMSGSVSGTSTSASFIGVFANSGLSVIGNVTANTIGSSSTSGAISFSSSSSSASDVYGIFYFPSLAAIISNNIVGGISASNTSTGAIVFYGIRAWTSSSVTNLIQNNTVGFSAAPISLSSATTASRGIGIYSQSGASVVTGNIVRNMTMNGANTGTGSTASMIGIWSDNTSATIGNNISQNIVHSLSNTAPAAVSITGLHYNGTTGTHLVQRNFVHSLSVSSATATMNGIFIQAGTTTYQNNMVRLGIDAAGNSITVGCAINGINELVGTNNFYFNSVYVGGTSVNDALNTFAFNSSVTVNTRNYRDNIFQNSRSNGAGSGKHYAVKVGGTTPNPTGLTINNNVYYANGTGGVFGFYNSLDVANLAAWQTAVGQDANSFYSDPQFLTPNGTALTVDLHINPSLASVIEGNGFNIGSVTDDYDGQTRSGLTPVDIGADAGNFIGIDLSGPSISYTPLANNSSFVSVTLSPVTVTDASGVNGTSGTAPRIYFKKKNDANTFGGNTSTDNGWKWTESTGTSPFSLTINYAIIFGGTVSAGDTIQYFVVAQDLQGTPLVSSNPSAGFVGTSVASITSAPTTPNFYKVVGTPLLGDYTVGLLLFNRASGKNIKSEKLTRTILIDVEISQSKVEKVKTGNEENLTFDVLGYTPTNTVKKLVTEEHYVLTENGQIYQGPLFNESVSIEGKTEGIYATLTAAINDLNERGAGGHVRFLLNDPSFTEAGTMTINITSADTLNSSKTLTIKPNTGVTTTITTNSASPVFIVAEHYVTIDGSNSTGGTSRDMSITNSGTSTTSGVAFVAASNNVTFKNLIGATLSSATSYGIVYDASNNGLVENCELKKGILGIQSQSSSNNIVFKKNQVGSTVAAEKLQNAGIIILSSTNFTVDSNRVFGVTRSSTASIAGVLVGVQTGGIAPTNGTISRNEIMDVKHTGVGTSAYGAFGIQLAGSDVNANISVVNNTISDIWSDGDLSATFAPHGIYIISGGGYKIYYNSVNLFGNVTSNGDADPIRTGALTINFATASNLDIRNNIFVNSQEITGTSAVAKAHAIYCGSPSTAFTNINYNNYYAPNVNDGMLGYLGADVPDLAGWQTATGQDANSKNAAITYVGLTDLHLSGGSIGDVNLTGTPLAGITVDIDNQTRNAVAPYMGADEIPGSPLVRSLNLTALIEGFWDGSSMVSDTVTVELHNTTNPWALVDQAKVVLNSNGNNPTVNFFSAADAVDYYIVVKHRNSIETWSKLPQQFTGGALTYDFTTAAAQAYGNNLKLKSGKYCIFSGDVNGSGTINVSDINAVFAASNLGLTGYVVTDVNGSNTVNVTDINITYANSNLGVSVQKPTVLSAGKEVNPVEQTDNKEIE